MIKKKYVLATILIWPIVASILSLYLEVNYLISGMLFLALPSLIISYFQRDIILKDTVFSILLAVPFTFIIEYLSHSTGAYKVESMFGLTIFDIITVDSFIWAFFAAYFPVAFFEYFVEDHKVEEIFPDRMRYFATFSVMVVVLALILLPHMSKSIHIPYYYFIQGFILFVIPIAVEFYEYPSEIRKVLEAGAYFFYFGVIYELTALELEIWSFPATNTSFVGWVSIFEYRFPIEELVFWVALTGMAVISIYDLWDDYSHLEN